MFYTRGFKNKYDLPVMHITLIFQLPKKNMHLILNNLKYQTENIRLNLKFNK